MHFFNTISTNSNSHIPVLFPTSFKYNCGESSTTLLQLYCLAGKPHNIPFPANTNNGKCFQITTCAGTYSMGLIFLNSTNDTCDNSNWWGRNQGDVLWIQHDKRGIQKAWSTIENLWLQAMFHKHFLKVIQGSWSSVQIGWTKELGGNTRHFFALVFLKGNLQTLH